MTTPALVHSMQRGYRLGIFFLLPPDAVSVLGALIVLVIASVALTLGYKTRFSAFLVWFLLLSFRNRNPYVWNCGDELIEIVSFLVMIGPSGAMYSLDALLRPKTDGKTPCAPWAQKLVQIQLCVVYLVSFFCKTGATWHDGTAVYYAMHIKFFTYYFPPYIFDHLWTCKLFSWSTLAVEFSLFTLIWIKRCRPVILAVGVCMHLCMLLFMNLHVLEFIMLACYINFIDPKTIERLMSGVRKIFAVVSGGTAKSLESTGGA